MKVATAGQCVNSASKAIAGSTSSQPWIAAGRRLFKATPARPRASGDPEPWKRKNWIPACAGMSGGGASPIRLQDPLRLDLRVLHRLLGRFRAGEGGLQAVIERLGDALVLVGGELRRRELELVARDR